MKPYKPIDPTAKMTRADFVVELLTMWEEALQIIQRNPSGSLQELGAKAELEAAVYVLKRSYPVHELVDVNAYDYIKTTVKKLELIHERYNRNTQHLVHKYPDALEFAEALGKLDAAFEDELSHLDRRPTDASV
jgi:hypothetical protein